MIAPDAFTGSALLCDVDGIVRDDPAYPAGYACTGSYHSDHGHIRCTNARHRTSVPARLPRVSPDNLADGTALVRVARELRDFLADEDGPALAAVLADVATIERVGLRLMSTVSISMTITNAAAIGNSLAVSTARGFST